MVLTVRLLLAGTEIVPDTIFALTRRFNVADERESTSPVVC